MRKRRAELNVVRVRWGAGVQPGGERNRAAHPSPASAPNFLMKTGGMYWSYGPL